MRSSPSYGGGGDCTHQLAKARYRHNNGPLVERLKGGHKHSAYIHRHTHTSAHIPKHIRMHIRAAPLWQAHTHVHTYTRKHTHAQPWRWTKLRERKRRRNRIGERQGWTVVTRTSMFPSFFPFLLLPLPLSSPSPPHRTQYILPGKGEMYFGYQRKKKTDDSKNNECK